MNNMSAVVLAAGEGKRLLPLTASIPKPLVKVKGISILENALMALCKVGVKNIKIVVGHHAEVIKSTFGCSFNKASIEYIYNMDYLATNSMYSLYLGLKDVTSPTFVLEGDVFFDQSILQIYPDDICWYVDSMTNSIDGAYLRKSKTDFADSLEIIRDIRLIKPEHCKSLGILSLSSIGVEKVKRYLSNAVLEGRTNLYYDLILADHIQNLKIKLIDVSGIKWFEIDTLDDLKKAEMIFS